MKVTGKEGGPIDRAQAKRWTAKYRSSGRGKTNSHLFGADTVRKLLEQEGCVGMRIYYALDDNGEQQLLLVGTDEEGSDMTEGLILDLSSPCPPDCSVSGELAG
ncbi:MULTISPECIES: hypothetical protein [Pontibacter]|uniref:Uncharacterized protein n=1 Tax=Pontibacter lucknowensis TaxID=1077936 RepID=A0A1N6YDA4_9BACT|nr:MULTISPECIES: hypothetical protein [Pontibacter]EJF08103.1 hypothetical protein O71_22891 [Pontibacter sp. BAB1700]SIR12530.1 hypothetical protein SAMN05421545_2424 [Pontibacter lucknowensis]